jgi:hypothetical protein
MGVLMSISQYLLEDLKKASDRIKYGKKKDLSSKDLSPHHVKAGLQALLSSADLKPEAKAQLKQMIAHIEGQIATGQMRDKGQEQLKPHELGERAASRNPNKEMQQHKIKEWLETNKPKEIKQLGHEKQYQEDVNNPKLRSRAAQGTSSGVKDKLMGENIAIRDKKYGQALDLQRKIKDKEKQLKAGKGPESVITVKGGIAITDEHKNDVEINNLQKLKAISPIEHHPHIDDEIKTRISSLNLQNKMNTKS